MNKKRFIRLIITYLPILISTIFTDTAFCQFFETSQNIPSIKWRQISTNKFRIIYPTGMEPEAERMVNTVTGIIKTVGTSLHKEPRKISIILQNQGTTSNGFVQLAPRRSEFFTTPAQEFDFQDWLNSLALHELRHVVQFDKLTGKLKAPFFEELALAIFGVTLPAWFYEGDAVGMETALTNAGRGRQPEFDLILRTNTLSGKKFSYSKDFMGSVKDFPPGYYQLGYYMTTKLKRDNGPGVMDSLFTRMSRNPVRLYNLSNSVKRFTGMSTRQLHDSTITELEEIWKIEQLANKPADYPIVNKRKNSSPVNFVMPVAISNNEFIALKQGKAMAPVFVKLDTQGNESTILKIGLQEELYFRYAAGKLVWDESRYAARYQKKSYNVINIYELATGRYKQLTHHTRLFSPALSPTGDTLIAVDISYSNQISLVSLNAATGKELKRYNSPMNYMLQNPSFNESGDKIIVAAVGKDGKTLYELSLKDGKFIRLLPFQKQLLSKPVYVGDAVVFKAHYNGIDNLYKLELATNAISQLTSVKYGAYNPSYDKGRNRIIFNDYQAAGYDIAYIPNTDQNKAIAVQYKNTAEYIQPVVLQEGVKNVFDSIPSRKYDSKRFRESGHLFYFHSLRPILEESDYFNNNYSLGLKIQSDNLLNTLSFYTGYRYNTALNKSEYVGGFTYSRYFPVLNITYLNQARLIYQRKLPFGELTPITWRENEVEAKILIPLAINRLNYTYSIGTELGTSYLKRYSIVNPTPNLVTELKFPMLYRLYISRNAIRSGRDLAPVWGQNVSIAYRNFPFEKQLTGELLTFKSTFYFPGILENHSLQASFNYQQGTGNYESVTDIPLVSGYGNLKNITTVRNTLLADYRFPLFYPDWELGPLAYIKRFSGGIFADFQNFGKNKNYSPVTYGAEIRADMNLLRFYLPNFTAGGKVIFVNDKSRQKPILEASLTYSY